jgi:hypothetical protein
MSGVVPRAAARFVSLALAAVSLSTPPPGSSSLREPKKFEAISPTLTQIMRGAWTCSRLRKVQQ